MSVMVNNSQYTNEITVGSHPEFYARYEKVVARIREDYPNFDAPPLLTSQYSRYAHVNPENGAIEFNPDFLNKITANEFEFVVAHELGHVAMRHRAETDRLWDDIRFQKLDNWVHGALTSVVGLSDHEAAQWVLSYKDAFQKYEEAQRAHECEADHVAVFYTDFTSEEAAQLFASIIQKPGDVIENRVSDVYVEIQDRVNFLSDDLLEMFKPGDISFDGECNINGIHAAPVRDVSHDLTLQPQSPKERS